MAAACPGVDSQDLATILDPFCAILADLGPGRLSEHYDVGTVETSETSTLCVNTRQMSVLATKDICPVPAADISPVSKDNVHPVSTEDRTAAGRWTAAVMPSV